MYSKILNWILLLFAVLLVVNIIRSFNLVSLLGKEIAEMQSKLQGEKDSQQNLKRQLAQVESDTFVEKEARNKLNLGRDGEIMLLLPSIAPIIESSPTPEVTMPNWKQWLKVITD